MTSATMTGVNGGAGSPAGLGRSPAFRLPVPPVSPYPGASVAPVAPIPVPQSPVMTSGSGSSRFSGLNLGFRRNRGQSTSRDLRNDAFTPSTAGLDILSSAPAFPALSASSSQPDLPQSQGQQNWFDENYGSASSASASSINLSSSIPAGARNYFSRRGFVRKVAGGNRTPTSEAPPLTRARSSSQPSLHRSGSLSQSSQDSQPPVPSTANPVSGSFFPQYSPRVVGTPSNEAEDPITNTVMTPLANNATTTPASNAGMADASVIPSGTVDTQPQPTIISSSSTSSTTAQHIRLVPHLDMTRSLTFDPVNREVLPTVPLRIGRFTDRAPNQPVSAIDLHRIVFRSKVVSRTHAEMWFDSEPPATGTTPATNGGGWYIRDLKSSSGTFLNHIRLSGAGVESRPFPLRDGDILQLGVDYQGGAEEMYRCVKMRVELNRAWQRGANSFK